MSIQLLSTFVESLEEARKLHIPHLEIRQLPFSSVVDYAGYERIPKEFPRPECHFVIADYLIDLPVVAADLSTASEDYGRIIGYSYDDYWVVADSITELVERLRVEGGSALFGK